MVYQPLRQALSGGYIAPHNCFMQPHPQVPLAPQSSPPCSPPNEHGHITYHQGRHLSNGISSHPHFITPPFQHTSNIITYPLSSHLPGPSNPYFGKSTDPKVFSYGVVIRFLWLSTLLACSNDTCMDSYGQVLVWCAPLHYSWSLLVKVLVINLLH